VTEVSAKAERSALRDMFTRSRRGEMFAIAASGLAGLLSLLVSTYNVYLQRAQVRAQVWPNVEWLYNGRDGAYEQVLKNTGIGPARVAGARVSIDGKPFDTWANLMPEVLGHNPLLRDGIEFGGGYSQIHGRTVPAGTELSAMKVSVVDGPQAQAKHQALVDAFDRVRTEICYCSALDDCWLFDNQEGTKAVSKCPMERLTFKN
jgi:hypothetical protein